MRLFWGSLLGKSLIYWHKFLCSLLLWSTFEPKSLKLIYRNDSSVEHHGVEFMIVAEIYKSSPNCSLSVRGEVLEI